MSCQNIIINLKCRAFQQFMLLYEAAYFYHPAMLIHQHFIQSLYFYTYQHFIFNPNPPMQKIRKKMVSQNKEPYLLNYGQNANKLEPILWKSRPELLRKKLTPDFSIFPLLSQIHPHHQMGKSSTQSHVKAHVKVRRHLRRQEARTQAILFKEEHKLKIYDRVDLSSSDLVTQSLRINCPKDKKVHNRLVNIDKRCCSKKDYAQIFIAINSHKKIRMPTVQTLEESIIEPMSIPIRIQKRSKTVMNLDELSSKPEHKYTISPWEHAAEPQHGG